MIGAFANNDRTTHSAPGRITIQGVVGHLTHDVEALDHSAFLITFA